MKTFEEQGINAYPLCWPVGWKRTSYRKESKFRTGVAVARDQLFRELKLMGVRNNEYVGEKVILSTNIPLRRDGLPLAGQSNPKDPGVSVYFIYKRKPMVFACDTYLKVEDNLYAITKTIEALRGIQRWGASDMLERSFTGFEALPPPADKAAPRTCWEILGVTSSADVEEIRDAWRARAQKVHPDKIGGSNEAMSELNAAYHNALKIRGVR